MLNDESVVIKLIAPLIMFYYRSDRKDNVIPFDLGLGFKIEAVDKKSEIEPLFKTARTISEYERDVIMNHTQYAITCEYDVTRAAARNLSQAKHFLDK